jgi:putative SOS response-associated peptidase YedK
MGHAGTSAVRWCAGHKHPQRLQPALARLAVTPWRGVRGTKSAPVEGEHELFGFLTTEANTVVAPIHPKAMPVILTTPEEVDLWLGGETPEALKLQSPLPDELLRIVARGELLATVAPGFLKCAPHT